MVVSTQSIHLQSHFLEIAAKGAFRVNLCLKAGAQLLSQSWTLTYLLQKIGVGDVIGDLNRRRGMIKDQQAGVTGVRIKADVPLSKCFGYIGHLRTITSGRGHFLWNSHSTLHVQWTWQKK